MRFFPILQRALFVLFFLLSCQPVGAETLEQLSQKRFLADLAQQKPIVIHVLVALADNQYQGIQPVSATLGNGQNPNSNLYWGAQFGIKTYFKKLKDWQKLDYQGPNPKGVLERLVFKKNFVRSFGVKGTVYLIADAWDGKEIRSTIGTFLEYSAGKNQENISFLEDGKSIVIPAGGNAHLITYVGHNGLMDFPPPTLAFQQSDAKPRSVAVLACASSYFFNPLFKFSGGHSLVTTTHLMAPEAYNLEALINTWLLGGSEGQVREAVAQAYHRYQKCGIKAARKLFGVQSK